LYDFHDSPEDLFERLRVNIEMNEQWRNGRKRSAKVYSYPMHYAPTTGISYAHSSPYDELQDTSQLSSWTSRPRWTSRFVRNVEIMKGAANGAISSTPSLARRTVGRTFREFLANLYMPEELLRNRDRHERRRYNGTEEAGTGLVESFRDFFRRVWKGSRKRLLFFHNAVSSNSASDVRRAISESDDSEVVFWLKQYLVR
jgi:hypothetical protein